MASKKPTDSQPEKSDSSEQEDLDLIAPKESTPTDTEEPGEAVESETANLDPGDLELDEEVLEPFGDELEEDESIAPESVLRVIEEEDDYFEENEDEDEDIIVLTSEAKPKKQKARHSPTKKKNRLKRSNEPTGLDALRHRPNKDPKPALRSSIPDLTDNLEHHISAATQRSTEETWGQSDGDLIRIPWGWFALLGIVILAAVTWSLFQLFGYSEKEVVISKSTVQTTQKEEQEDAEAEKLVTNIQAALSAFYNATTVEDMLKLVRDQKRIAPLMASYYEDRPVFTSKLDRINNLQPITLEQNANFWIASSTLEDGTKNNLLIEAPDPDHIGIDWETAVCYQPMDWEKYVTERPEGTTLDFRVYAEPDQLYSHEFEDSSQWQCYLITTRDSNYSIFGYAQRDSETNARIIDAIRKSNRGSASLILRLVIPEGIQSHSGVMIEKLIAPRWIFIDPPPTE